MVSSPVVLRAPEVWTADLDEPGGWPDPDGVLVAAERVRADRFHRKLDRERWIRGRCLARTILARHVDVDPRQLRWVAGAEGKPSLEHPGAPFFNVSHSGAIFVLAVHEHGPVGIDVELVRPLQELASLLSQVLSTEELLRIDHLQGMALLLAFYKSWTAKEAILKCLGRGLNAALKDVVLANTGDQQAPVVERVSIAGWDPDLFQLARVPIDHEGSWSPTQVQSALVWKGVPASPMLRNWSPTSCVRNVEG